MNPEYPCHQHVDDLSHVLVAETAKELETQLLEAGRILGQEVKRLRLTLSTKSKIVPENSTTSKVARILENEGIPWIATDTLDDVGIQQSGGTVRAETTLNERIHGKGAPRAGRIHALVH